MGHYMGNRVATYSLKSFQWIPFTNPLWEVSRWCFFWTIKFYKSVSFFSVVLGLLRNWNTLLNCQRMQAAFALPPRRCFPPGSSTPHAPRTRSTRCCSTCIPKSTAGPCQTSPTLWWRTPANLLWPSNTRNIEDRSKPTSVCVFCVFLWDVFIFSPADHSLVYLCLAPVAPLPGVSDWFFKRDWVVLGPEPPPPGTKTWRRRRRKFLGLFF